MADTKQRKVRKRKEPQESGPAPPDVATKEETAIAGWMRQNIPVKKTKFINHTVEYFTANKAIDALMDSPWAKSKKAGEEPLFTTRESIVSYMDLLLRHKFFHRARKIVVPESELNKNKKKGKEKDKEKDKEKEKEKEKDKKSKESAKKEDTKEGDKKKEKREDTVTAAESSQAEGDKGENKAVKHKKEEGEKKKRKIRLDMHLEQCFVDSTDAYVWIYQPTPYYYYFFGFLVVVAVIAVCLFPLWPSSVRQGVYYLSLAAAGFLVFILALAVLRIVVFCIVWGLTFGRHHLWLFPNLTEDVGFFASFWPLYKYEYKGEVEEEEEDEDEETEGKEKSDEVDDDKKPLIVADKGKGPDEHSGTDSDSQPSQTGKDFEMVDREEIEP